MTPQAGAGRPPRREAVTGSLVPTVGPQRAMKLPAVEERTMANGLRVLAVRRAGVPRFEARLVIPTARGNTVGAAAVLRVLAKTILSGTATRTSAEIAQDLQRLGADLDAGADAEDVALHGSALAVHLRPFLELLGEVLVDATYPAEEVALERDRMAQELVLARSQPTTIVREAFVRRCYGRHPYGRGLPTPTAVLRVSPAALRAEHGERLRPGGSVLVLVGDVRPATALDEVERALGAWAPGGASSGLPAPKPAVPGPTVIVDRPGAVQTNIRIGGPAVGRGHPGYPRLALANLIYGGYFTSRLVDNIRERRGYTYSPGSGIAQQRSASLFTVQADVGTDVTAPALLEIRYELGRMVASPADEAELTAAKRYLSGSLSMATQTQAGLASYLSTLAVHGLGVSYLRDLPKEVDRLGPEEVLDAARAFLSPKNMVTVLVGDASAIRDGVEAVDEVEVVAPR